MEELVLQSSWKEPSGNNYIAITNVFIEGALFDGITLTPCEAESESINAIPDCFLNWIKLVRIKLCVNDKSFVVIL